MSKHVLALLDRCTSLTKIVSPLVPPQRHPHTRAGWKKASLVFAVPIYLLFLAFSASIAAQTSPGVSSVGGSAAVPPVQLPPIQIQPPIYTAPPIRISPSLSPSISPRPLPRGPSAGGIPVQGGVAYVIAVCIYTKELSDECLDNGVLQATQRLGGLYLNQYLEKRTINSLTLRFPDFMSKAQQIHLLYKIERKAIQTVMQVIHADVAKLTPFIWETQQEKEQKEEFIRNEEKRVEQWEKDAISEANSGDSWSNDWPSNSHTFQAGHAFRQLQHISIHGW